MGMHLSQRPIAGDVNTSVILYTSLLPLILLLGSICWYIPTPSAKFGMHDTSDAQEPR